jgi:hypothetical protein
MHQHRGENLQLFLLSRHLPPQIRPLYRTFDSVPDRFRRDFGFTDVVGCTTLHGFGGDAFIALARCHDDRHIGKALMQGGDALQAVGARHAVVDDRAVEGDPATGLQRLLNARGLNGVTGKARGFQRASELLAVAFVVIDDKDVQPAV